MIAISINLLKLFKYILHYFSETRYTFLFENLEKCIYSAAPQNESHGFSRVVTACHGFVTIFHILSQRVMFCNEILNFWL